VLLSGSCRIATLRRVVFVPGGGAWLPGRLSSVGGGCSGDDCPRCAWAKFAGVRLATAQTGIARSWQWSAVTTRVVRYCIWVNKYCSSLLTYGKTVKLDDIALDRPTAIYQVTCQEAETILWILMVVSVQCCRRMHAALQQIATEALHIVCIIWVRIRTRKPSYCWDDRSCVINHRIVNGLVHSTASNQSYIQTVAGKYYKSCPIQNFCTTYR
jgi:hypothetical protein